VGPTFIDGTIGTSAAVQKSGYSRTANYDTALTVPGLTNPHGTYCYQASPITAGTTGVRAFGGDSSGVVGVTNTSATNCCNAGVLQVATCPALR
jgi:hypothetical protein